MVVALAVGFGVLIGRRSITTTGIAISIDPKGHVCAISQIQRVDGVGFVAQGEQLDVFLRDGRMRVDRDYIEFRKMLYLDQGFAGTRGLVFLDEHKGETLLFQDGHAVPIDVLARVGP